MILYWTFLNDENIGNQWVFLKIFIWVWNINLSCFVMSDVPSNFDINMQAIEIRPAFTRPDTDTLSCSYWWVQMWNFQLLLWYNSFECMPSKTHFMCHFENIFLTKNAFMTHTYNGSTDIRESICCSINVSFKCSCKHIWGPLYQILFPLSLV